MGDQAIEIGRAEERELEIELRRPHERKVDRPQVRVRPHPLELDAQDPLEPDVLDRRIHVGERHLCGQMRDVGDLWEICGRSVGEASLSPFVLKSGGFFTFCLKKWRLLHLLS